MIKKLADKQLVMYQKYQGVLLTDKGLMAAKMIVRKHRLWEVFLVEKLDFAWDEVASMWLKNSNTSNPKNSSTNWMLF